MALKEFTFKGKKMEELKTMSIEEFAKLLNARGRRSIKRGLDEKLLKKIGEAREKVAKGNHQVVVRTHSRDMIVVPSMVGLTFGIHSGNEFKLVEIKPEMLGHYLGEFALTRKKISHGKAGIGATKSSTAITARG